MNEQTGATDNKEESTGANAQQTTESRGEGRRGGRNRSRRHNRAPQPQPEASLNMTELREIAELINQHGFTDFEFENENIRVRLRKELQPQIVQVPQVVTQTTPTLAPQAALQTPSSQPKIDAISSAATAPTTATTAPADEEVQLHKIVSPIVGTFYGAPSPGAEPFVKVGSQVSAETIVCIVEAMKLMNEIPAEISGEVVKIYVENGQPVEYGQPLFAVK